jgi:hypothetical protein
MKFAAAILAIFVAAAKAEDAPITTEVVLELNCDHVAFDQLTLTEQEFSSQVLQDTFDTIHIDIDNGDEELSDIHFENPTMLANIIKNMSTGELKYQRRGGWGAYFAGGYSCRFCPNRDDDEMLGYTMGASSTDHKAWEDQFTSKLHEHPLGVFNDAKNCKIAFKKTPKDIVEQQ